MVGFDNVYAFETVANRTQWMTIFIILIWIQYHLEIKTVIINITSFEVKYHNTVGPVVGNAFQDMQSTLVDIIIKATIWCVSVHCPIT